MKKRTKAIMAIILLVILAMGGASGYLLLFHQPAPVVNDYTADNGPSENTDSTAEYADEENIAVFSSSVHMYTDEDAEAINGAISSRELTNHGLVLQVAAGTALDELGVGDIFYLEGDSSTPLGETYIGKITSESAQDGATTYIIDDPMIDEVFDVLNIDISQALTNENITSIEAAEGVTVTQVDNVASYFTSDTSSDDAGYQVTTLQSGSFDGQASALSSYNDSDLLVEFELDLFEALGLDKPDSTKFKEKYDYQEGERITVYTTSTGFRYHQDNCGYVSRSKHPSTLTDAVYEKYAPCTLCTPPILDDDEGTFEFKPELKLTGKVGFEELACDVVFDWDILSGNGLENLSVGLCGNYLVDIEATANYDLEFGGRKTTFSLPFDSVKIQGLKEKLFPAAFINFSMGAAITPINNEGIRFQTSSVPLTIAAAVYIDGNGKVSLGSKAYFNYTQAFDYTKEIVRDGEWVMDSTYVEEPAETKAGLEVELSGDMDFHVGASLLLYVFNLNPVDAAIAKLGGEGEGSLKLSWSTGTEGIDDAISSSYYLRAYLKFLEIKIRIKAKANFGSWSADIIDADLTLTAADVTLEEWGSKNPTRYKSSEMEYSAVTARDAENLYYKDTNGDLIKETDGSKTALYTDEFFTICGIDESYIYILRNNADVSGTHDIHRVSVHDGTGKVIAEEVTNCLMIDDRYLYYVSGFDANTILRLDRETLKEETFYTSAGQIRYMASQDDGYYVVAEESDAFSWLFGSSVYYLFLNESGMVVTEYGSDPSVPSLLLYRLSDYYESVKMVSSGYLRSTAEKVYWLSTDRTDYYEAVGISGWNPQNTGIFTTLRNEDTTNAPYHIALYRAQDGQKVTVTDVQSDHAFFTLCQSSTGSWFFFDETEDSLILYSMNSDFSNKTVVKTFSLSEIPYSLTECGMTIMDDRIYFYTIPDNATSHVLYRYDII